MRTEAVKDHDRVATLNSDCFCVTLDRAKLRAAIRADDEAPDSAATLLTARPHLFSDSPVFLASANLAAMLDVVAAIEVAASTPAYQQAVLAWAPTIARHDFDRAAPSWATTSISAPTGQS